jgi:hypothetical protein
MELSSVNDADILRFMHYILFRNLRMHPKPSSVITHEWPHRKLNHTAIGNSLALNFRISAQGVVMEKSETLRDNLFIMEGIENGVI